MDPTALGNDESDHSGDSQHFPDGVILGPVPIPVVDMVSLESDGEVVSGSNPSINEIKNQLATIVVPDQLPVLVPDQFPVLVPNERLLVAIQRIEDHSDDEND
ncbi:hypothetical protein PanWU01x14_084500, partial [Parasponia andersonii]